jgi:putative autotransporter adhesin-like protein
LEKEKDPPMKKFGSLIIGLTLAMGGCDFIDTNRVKGSGVSKTEKRSLGAFTSIDVSCAGSIQVRAHEPPGLEISGDDNIVPLITTEVKSDTLYIRSAQQYAPRDKLQITISAPDLKKFLFNGAGEASLANIKNDQIEIEMSGAGSLSASGETKGVDISLTGAGSVDAKDLHAVTAKVNSTGVGSIDVYATAQLDVTASGIGEVNYYGNPKTVNRNGTGIGGINAR